MGSSNEIIEYNLDTWMQTEHKIMLQALHNKLTSNYY